jgi:hypothetical protein
MQAILTPQPENMPTAGLFVSYVDVNHTPDPNLPSDPDHTNDWLAQQADSILVMCEEGCSEDVSLNTLSNLLSKMAHWCDRNDFQMADVMKMAATSYGDDTATQGRQFSA